MDRKAKIAAFKSRRKAEHAALLRVAEQLVLALEPKLSPGAYREVKDALADRTKQMEGRSFVQLDFDVMAEVEDLLDKHSVRPGVARKLLVQMFRRLDRHSQEVLASRAELAQMTHTHPGHISTAIVELERLNVLWREPGEGRSKKVFVNPRLGTKMDWNAVQTALTTAPLIRDPDAPPLPKGRPELRVV